ncbi:MauE/DoxX family redox-associated membrane protein [Brachybacterium sp. YJGR34]|uniref:TlpA family protein disulfide reductase n=1 Tax=Brachybacterium sp. YJGR34 TaxID=2059911 RepID=UPI000E0B02D2|nr:MauE/DoxX family redox-associated membrane protein [Brachybacterium sp. YJGR34]
MMVLLTAPILLSLTLLVSGLAKLGARRGTVDAMTSLRLPGRGLHRAVANALPVLEIVLALVLWVPVVPLQVAVSALIAALMIVYLVIIARALTFEEPVECSCFGSLASPTVSRRTLARNLVLALLALLTVPAASAGLLARTLELTPLALVGLGIALGLTIVLTVLTLGGASTATPNPADGEGVPGLPSEADSAEDEELLDYERDPIPGAVLQRPGGRLITLNQLTAQQAALLIFVTEGCGPCERVLDEIPGWLETLSPSLQVIPVFSRPLDQLRERTIARVGDSALHDLQFVARSALGGRGAPSAVLLGADGLLAGGPVTGGDAVIGFVEEIQEQLRIARAEGELPEAP